MNFHLVSASIFLSAGLYAQTASRLVGYSFRGSVDDVPMVLSDSMSYLYSGTRGGDIFPLDLRSIAATNGAWTRSMHLNCKRVMHAPTMQRIVP